MITSSTFKWEPATLCTALITPARSARSTFCVTQYTNNKQYTVRNRVIPHQQRGNRVSAHLHLHGLHHCELLTHLHTLTDFHTAGDQGTRHGAQQRLGQVTHHRGQHVGTQALLGWGAEDDLLLGAQVAEGEALGGAAEALHHSSTAGVLSAVLVVEGSVG